MDGKEVEKRERDKRAGGKVGQQKPRAPSHYDSSSSCMSPGVDCKPQSPRPDRETGERAWKTAVSQGARGKEGCSTEDRHMKRRHDPTAFLSLRLQYQSLELYQLGSLQPKKPSLGELDNCPCAFRNETNHHVWL